MQTLSRLQANESCDHILISPVSWTFVRSWVWPLSVYSSVCRLVSIMGKRMIFTKVPRDSILRWAQNGDLGKKIVHSCGHQNTRSFWHSHLKYVLCMVWETINVVMIISHERRLSQMINVKEKIDDSVFVYFIENLDSGLW